MEQTDLSKKMCELADSGHPRADELREKATEFDEKSDEWMKDSTKIKPFMGAWARARRCWSECSGEPLI